MRKSINKLARLFSVSTIHFVILQFAWIHAALAESGVAPAVPGAPAGTALTPPARPSILETVTPFLLMFGVMYLLILRPQQKKMKQQQEMLAKLEEGDEVVTAFGIFGKVKALNEKVVTLEIADKVSVRVVRGQIAQKVSSESKS